MRILFVADSYSIHTVRWVNALAGRGHEVHLASREPGWPLVHPIEPQVIIHSLGNYRKIASIRAGFVLRILIRKIQPDIINAHFASSYGLTARIAGGHPLLLNVWGSDVYVFPYKSWLNRMILRGNLRAADRIASTSPAMADQVRRLLGKSSLAVAITPFGVELDDYPVLPTYSNDVQELVIGLVKSLKPVYGLEYLLAAMPLLRDRLQAERPGLAGKIRLHIYGEGELRRSLQGQADRLGLGSMVQFKGYVNHGEVPAILSGMALCCLPSLQESFGVAAVEAMAAGLPVVATDTEGFRDIVLPGHTGTLVPPGDARALADALFPYCIDPGLRQRHGTAGRQRVREHYDWNRNVDTMEDIYRDMVRRS